MSPPTCREVERSLDGYARGDLPRDEREAVEVHLAGCERCREAAELWSGFSFALASTDLDPLPPLVERRIAVAAADAQPARSDEPGRRAARTRWIAGLAAAAAVAAGAALWIALSPSGDATGQDAPGVADRVADQDRPAPDRSDDRQVADARPTARGQGRQLIEVDDVTNLWIEEGSSVRVERLEDRLARFRLDAGRVVAEVGPHPQGFRFIVVTPSGEVEAKGTIFAVEVRPGAGERARVMRGVVEVRAKAGSAGEAPQAFLVRAGESGRVGDREPVPLASEEMERDVCLLRGCAVVGGPVEVASIADDAPAGAACEPAVAEPADEAAKAAPRPAGNGRPNKSVQAAKSAAGKGSGATGDAVPHATSPDDWQVETLVSLALSQRRAGMYPTAAETYRKLIREHSATAAARNALVSLGQLELVELGRPQEALGLFERYLGLAPAGLLAEEARLGRVRAYARMGRDQDVVGAASDYLRLHLGGYAGAEVMRLRADARRKLGDCLGAIEDYRQVQSLWPTSPQNNKAEAGLAACRAEP